MRLSGGFVFSAPQPSAVEKESQTRTHTHAPRQRPTRPPVSIMTPHSFKWTCSPTASPEKVVGSQVASVLCGPFSTHRSVTSHHVAVTQVILQESSADEDELTHRCDDTLGLNSFLEIFRIFHKKVHDLKNLQTKYFF